MKSIQTLAATTNCPRSGSTLTRRLQSFTWLTFAVAFAVEEGSTYSKRKKESGSR